MKRQVVFSRNAENSLINLLAYLDLKWSVKVKNEFIEKLEKSMFIIQNQPEIFPKSLFNIKISKCVISKQSTIYYRFNDKQIRVLALFDTRQNPSKSKNIK